MAAPTDEVGDLLERAESEPGSLSDADVERLIDHGTPDALRALQEAFETIAAADPDRATRLLEGLEPAFDADDGEVRRLAFRAVARVARQDPGAAAELVDTARAGLDDDHAMVRAAAADVLDQVAMEAPAAVEPAVPDLRALLDDEHLHLRERALGIAFGLSAADPAMAAPLVPELLAFVGDRYEPGATAEINPMEGNTRGAFRDLEREEHGAQVQRRNRAAATVAAIAEARPGAIADHVPRILDLHDAEQWPVIREHLVEALVPVAGEHPEAAAPAIPALGDTIGGDRDDADAAAAMALVLLGEEYPEAVVDAARPGVPTLTDLLGADDPEVRSVAAGLLSQVAEVDPEAAAPATDALIDRLDDGQPFVREAAAWTLAAIGDDAAIAALREALAAAGDDDVRSTLEEALEWAGADRDGG